MGHARRRPGQDGKPRYTAHYDDLRGRRRSAGTYATKREADAAWQRAEVKLAEGRIGDPRRGRQRLRQYVEEEWFPNHRLEATTRQNYRYELDRYVLPALGGMRMAEILPSHIREWVTAWTEPNEKGQQYRHGTATAYVSARCRYRPCKDVMAVYRSARRAQSKDSPRRVRQVDTDGHIGCDWFRRNVWLKALAEARLGFHLTPHALRHAHASWLLAGSADLQVVRERLGHGSITTTEKHLHTLPQREDAALAALARIRRLA